MITYLRRAWSVRGEVFEDLRNVKKSYPNESTLQALVGIIHSKIRVLDIVEKTRHKYPLKIAGNYYAAFLEVLHNIRTCEKINLPSVPKRGKEINFHVTLLELAEWCHTQAELQSKSTEQKAPTQGDNETGKTNGTAGSTKKCAWYWKLYEVSLKVIVDAVLERFWPKPK